MTTPSPTLFKAYDIRGVVGTTLTEEAAFLIGQAFGEMVYAQEENTVILGRDGRHSSPALSMALAKGLQSVGIHVIDIGLVATPILYFATHTLSAQSGIMITGSHNPPAYNGFKLVLSKKAIYGEMIQSIYDRIVHRKTHHTSLYGQYHQQDISSAYLKKITETVHLQRPIHIAVDCGNGAPGKFAGELYRQLGCQVDELFCDIDGDFPHHHPDPANPDNLQALIQHMKMSQAELGLAFDGDGDRLAIVTQNGHIIFADRLLMLLAQSILTTHPGAPILYDVKCTGLLHDFICKHGGTPFMWKTGHSLIKAKMQEINAPLGAEMSGHIFLQDRWYGFDDALYAGARLLEVLSSEQHPSAVLDQLPQSYATPELHFMLEEGANVELIQSLQAKQHFYFQEAKRILNVDGVRAEYDHGFGLIRASNTIPAVTLRFEAKNEDALAEIQAQFRHALSELYPHLTLPF